MAIAATELDAGSALRWIETFVARAGGELHELADLDRRAGDGDYGFNLGTALDRLRNALEEGIDGSVGAPFEAASGAFLGTGGTSGPLFGVWFRELARAGRDLEVVDLEVLATAMVAGVDAVRRLGRARVGDKTMVDAMDPATQALERAATSGSGLEAGLEEAAAAARAGAESTTELVARKGRASYVGEVARGVTDPGAITVAIFFEAAPRGTENIYDKP